MCVYVLRKAIEMAAHMSEQITYSESKLLEEEVNGWLLLVSSVWVVISIRKKWLDS